MVCKPLIQGCLFYYYLLWATFFKKDLSDLHGGNFQVIGQLEVRNRETAGMHLAFLLRKEGQLVHTVEANYYRASTLLIIRFYYVYLSCRDTRSVWHSTSIFRAVFDFRSLFFVQNRTETLATQAIKYRALKHFVIVPDKIILSRFRRF